MQLNFDENSLIIMFQGNFWVSEHTDLPGGWCLPVERLKALQPTSPQPRPAHLFYLVVPEVYPS